MSLDQNISWENLGKVRNNLLKKFNGSCHYLLPNELIRQNIKRFMNLVNASSTNLQQNLTKDVINRGAKMFLYLNSCPPKTVKFYTAYFQQVFKSLHYDEPSNSGIVLYTLNAMKLFPNDGRVIASKILEKILTLFELSSIQSQKSDLTTREATNGMSMNLNFYLSFRHCNF